MRRFFPRFHSRMITPNGAMQELYEVVDADSGEATMPMSYHFANNLAAKRNGEPVDDDLFNVGAIA